MIGVLGLGSIGKRIAVDLVNNYKGKVLYLVREPKSVKDFAKKYKAKVRYADVSKPETLINALKGINAVIHAVHHEYNLNVMKACLKTRTHYLDLGGLYHYTKKQLKLNKQFKKNNLTAVIGTGASPGITNVLAKYGARFFDKIYNVQILIGGADFSTYKKESPLSNTYSIQTILEEFLWKPAVFMNGKTLFMDPVSGREEYRFPSPIGLQKPQYTIHSEIATLPYTLKADNVSFKIAFDDDFVDKILTLKRLGFLAEKDIVVKGARVNTKLALAETLKRIPKPVPEKLNQYEIIRVIIDGMKDGMDKQAVLDAKVECLDETIDKDTAVPASIVAQMIVNDEINKAGVFPPELIVPEERFFKELAKRKIFIYMNDRKIN